MNRCSFDDLKGKVCVITGGSGVLGTAMAGALAHSGVRTAILGRSAEKAQTCAAQIAHECTTDVIGVQGDVVDRESLEAAKAIINARLGQIDILVNGAGGNSPAATTKCEMMNRTTADLSESFFGLDLSGFMSVFDLNVMGTLLPTMVFAPDMVSRSQGCIVNVSSMNAFRPLTKIPAYSAAKAGINNLTQWLAVHLSRTGVRVNAIAPGFFLTDQNRFLLMEEDGTTLTPRGRKILAATPMGSFGKPADLCGLLLYLVSDLSRFVTGTIIPVDGGFSAYSGV